MNRKDIARFWARVDRHGPVPTHCPQLGPCWCWVGTLYDGYGRFSFDCSTRRAHCVAFLLTHGHWPAPCCLHRCDNRACVRPSHLREGTRAENVADMIGKGRARHATGDRSASRLHIAMRPRGPAHAARCAPLHPAQGERHGSAVLTEGDVRSVLIMHAADMQGVAIARLLGVTPMTVSHILNGKTWRHVTGLQSNGRRRDAHHLPCSGGRRSSARS